MAQPYSEFNKFQTMFFKSIDGFKEYSLYDVKRHGFLLISNISKGFPSLANIFLKSVGINWKAYESPAILKALQHRFVFPGKQATIPQFIYWKTPTKSKAKTIKKASGIYIFSDEIKQQICSILIIDSKTYDNMLNTELIQNIGKELIGKNVRHSRHSRHSRHKKKKV